MVQTRNAEVYVLYFFMVPLKKCLVFLHVSDLLYCAAARRKNNNGSIEKTRVVTSTLGGVKLVPDNV